MMRCTAKSKRSGEPCQHWPMHGRTVCYHHGGKTPVGLAAPGLKNGKYSKYLPPRLLEHYETARANPDLLAMRDEVALLDTRLTELLTALPDTHGARYPELWAEIVATIEQRRKVSESEQARLVKLQQYLTTEQAMLFLSVVTESIRRHVHDRAALAAITDDLRAVLHRER